jgi:hypothetical protein
MALSNAKDEPLGFELGRWLRAEGDTPKHGKRDFWRQ